jgi:hypothetical protein
MTVLREVVRLELAILVACFTVAVLWKMLRAAVRMVNRPALDKILRSGITGALRLQMPVASLVVALLYLLRLPQSAGSGSLPPIPGFALALLACSQAAFLGVMARRLFRPSGILKNEGEK